MKRPRFCIALSLIIMVPSLLISLIIFFVKFSHEYIDWLNGVMFRHLDDMDWYMIFSFIVFCLGAILLLVTLYTLDKQQEKEQKKLDA